MGSTWVQAPYWLPLTPLLGAESEHAGLERQDELTNRCPSTSPRPGRTAAAAGTTKVEVTPVMPSVGGHGIPGPVEAVDGAAVDGHDLVQWVLTSNCPPSRPASARVPAPGLSRSVRPTRRTRRRRPGDDGERAMRPLSLFGHASDQAWCIEAGRSVPTWKGINRTRIRAGAVAPPVSGMLAAADDDRSRPPGGPRLGGCAGRRCRRTRVARLGQRSGGASGLRLAEGAPDLDEGRYGPEGPRARARARPGRRRTGSRAVESHHHRLRDRAWRASPSSDRKGPDAERLVVGRLVDVLAHQHGRAQEAVGDRRPTPLPTGCGPRRRSRCRTP